MQSSSSQRVTGFAVRAVVEQLEYRRLLAVSLSAGSLNITGDASSESFTFSISATNLTVKRNSVSAGVFPLASITRVVANLGAGNDKLEMGLLNKPATLNGQDGNDTITGGLNKESISGGNGADSLKGGDNNDTIKG